MRTTLFVLTLILATPALSFKQLNRLPAEDETAIRELHHDSAAPRGTDAKNEVSESRKDWERPSEQPWSRQFHREGRNFER